MTQASASEAVRCDLPTNFVLGDDERQHLERLFLAIKSSPYTEYRLFTEEVEGLVTCDEIPTRLAEFCAEVITLDRRADPFVLMKNCPIDRGVPIFDYETPVESKRALKTSFIAEGFLALYAVLVDTPPIGYLNVNDGDVFQDIYPKRALKDTQSQKALGDIKFHKDLANHFVRPDYVNMLSMRADPANEVFTSFVRNEEALTRLPASILDELREPQFHTPYDDLTVAGGRTDVGEAPSHAVLKDDLDLCFFETRTVGLNQRAQQAVEALVRVLHELKARVLLMPGDFLSEHNNFSIHCKEIVRVGDPDTLRTRWIIKTVNVDRLQDHEQHFLPERYGIVNG